MAVSQKPIDAIVLHLLLRPFLLFCPPRDKAGGCWMHMHVTRMPQRTQSSRIQTRFPTSGSAVSQICGTRLCPEETNPPRARRPPHFSHRRGSVIIIRQIQVSGGGLNRLEDFDAVRFPVCCCCCCRPEQRRDGASLLSLLLKEN